MKEIGEPFKQMVGWDNPTILHYRRDDGTPGAFGGDNRFHTEKSIDELARSKRFTDAELAAEHWRQISVTQSALARATRSDDAWKRIITEDSRMSVMGRFVRFPSYDD